MSEYTSITDGLRGSMKRVQVFGSPFVQKEAIYFDQMCDAIDSVHAALEADNERLRGEWDFWESTHVELPKDADGVPIHIGDVLERGERHGEVIALMLSDNPWGDGNHWAIQLEGEHAPTVFDSLFHRYVPDTWERIEDDATMPPGDYVDKRMTVAHGTIETVDEAFEAMACDLVARCKALAGDAE